MSDFAPKQERESTKLDVAETFTESDVTVTPPETAVAGSLKSVGQVDSMSLGTDDTTVSATGFRGNRLNPNEPLTGVRGTLSANYGGEGDVARLTTASGTVLDTADVSGLTSGDSFILVGDMAAGNDYRVEVGSSSTTVTHGQENATATLGSTAFDCPGGSVDGSDTSNRYNISTFDVFAAVSSRTAYVEWPAPPDVYAWDTATFQRTLDGETVEVYVEEAQGSPGWTEVAGPISRGDAIPADPANNVRYRIEFSRSDISNNPTLDAIYRRIKL